MVALQVALSTILLVGSLLVVRSLQQATRVDVGFTPEHAVSVSLDLGLEGYDQARGRSFQKEIVEQLSTVPGVTAAATISALPLSQDTSTHGVHVEGQPVPRGTRAPSALYYQVSPGLFRALGTRIVAGRDFSESDSDDRPPLVIVNETFARRHLDGQALGRRFRTGPAGNWMEVIGVVQDGKYQTLGEDGKAVVFHSARQWYNPTTIVVARTSLDEQQALAALRRIVLEMDPHLTIFSDAPLRRVLALPLLPTRAAAGLLVAFGALAIVMVLVGIYGVTSYAVAQRSREISIRTAVGATGAQIVRLVLARAVWVWAAGVSAGLAVALAAAPMLSPILLGVAPRDPIAIVAAVVIIAGVTLAAVWHPSRRALAASPSVLLRDR
jgi:predicted permease